MSDLEKLTKKELIERLKIAEAKTEIDPNSMASVLMMNGRDAPAHYVKNVMHPVAKVFFFVIVTFLVISFTILGIGFILGTTT